MNYQDARSFIDESIRYGGEVGLGKIMKLLEYLGHPEEELTFIHIAGTNGKGSVLAYVSTILSGAGFRVGRYISPTLYSYEERFQVNGQSISKHAFTVYMEKIINAVRNMEADGFTCPTPFELETVLAFLYFRDMKCDYVVLECGLGGLEDATNVIKNTAVAVLTPISMDHMDYLGSTLTEIARNKSGIIKANAAVVTAFQEQEVMEQILESSSKHNCSCTCADYHNAEVLSVEIEEQSFRYKDAVWTIQLAGVCQIENAVIAIEVINALRNQGIKITDRQLKEGLRNTRWDGRFTLIHTEPYFIVDGAHNPHGAKSFADSMQLYFGNRNKIFIIGVLGDKEYEEVLRLTMPLASYVIAITPPNNKRALPAERLAVAAKKYLQNKYSIYTADSLEEAVDKAFHFAEKSDVIASFGSLSFIGELSSIVEKYGLEERNIQDKPE